MKRQKTNYAHMTSMMKKLDNQLKKEELERKERRVKKADSKEKETHNEY